MRDRAEKLGGHLSVRSRPGGGTTVEAIVQRREYDADLDTPTPRLE
jgi:nitrate/nitrite-specific signal transduction histidine kinase